MLSFKDVLNLRLSRAPHTFKFKLKFNFKFKFKFKFKFNFKFPNLSKFYPFICDVKVLVIEDEEQLLNSIKESLEKEKILVETAMEFKSIAILTFAALMTSCSNDDDSKNKDVLLAEADIPSAIIAYKTTHFPEHEIVSAYKDLDDNTLNYDVLLSGAVALGFNSSYEITDIDGTTQLPDSVIPQAILDYVAQSYPVNIITDWELERNHQQIELNNGLELEFELNGAFIRIDRE